MTRGLGHPLRVVNAKVRGGSNRREVLVQMKEWNPCAHRNCGNQTVDELANSLALTATTAINRRRGVEVDRLGRKQRGSRKQPPELLQVLLIASAGEDFHSNRIARRDSRSKKLVDALANRRSRVAQKLDPR